ncbi:MAG: type I methionyl aminopeptidase [Candidatus Woykebacteria bacterium RBG_13_40_7b]|uniref:Methionine aminopeptidase n=1 Tax=Candidatus Woykebacteria bacterium RBG_13_40_7b TaxID=1802594 RepID=A0A1G1W876_9BACT|nr:MAG: type I methionyl aminopeptidase [Candidatus Woykebacteria bacterium RBG_13_40_7b]
MIYYKNSKEIEIMAEAGKIAAAALKFVLKKVKPGVSTLELDKTAEDLIIKSGGEPSFKKVRGYKYSICTTVNEEVVHGLPSDRVLQNGDIVGVDLGAYFQGYHSDVAETIPVGEMKNEKVLTFLKTGKEALKDAIREAKTGLHIGDISFAIQTRVEGAGFGVVRNLVGHGIGKALHEDPLVPGFGKRGEGPCLREGMVLAIEVIYNMGSPKVLLREDGWTIKTADKSLSGLFERTVAVRNERPLILTTL